MNIWLPGFSMFCIAMLDYHRITSGYRTDINLDYGHIHHILIFSCCFVGDWMALPRFTTAKSSTSRGSTLAIRTAQDVVETEAVVRERCPTGGGRLWMCLEKVRISKDDHLEVSYRGTPSYHPFSWDVPWNQPSHFGYPHWWKPRFTERGVSGCALQVWAKSDLTCLLGCGLAS